MNKTEIIKAGVEDAPFIINLIEELARFEKLSPPDDEAKKRLINDAFPGNSGIPKFQILLAKNNNKTIGYAFYFFTYSSFLAKPTLYLEDIFITEAYRNSGIGMLFMNELIKIAEENNCGRMEWCVLDWNTNAINFYNKLGAKHLNEWLYYRINL